MVERSLSYTIKKMQPGDELTYDYGKAYFEEFIKPHGFKSMFCQKKQRSPSKKKEVRQANFWLIFLHENQLHSRYSSRSAGCNLRSVRPGQGSRRPGTSCSLILNAWFWNQLLLS